MHGFCGTPNQRNSILLRGNNLRLGDRPRPAQNSSTASARPNYVGEFLRNSHLAVSEKLLYGFVTDNKKLGFSGSKDNRSNWSVPRARLIIHTRVSADELFSVSRSSIK